MTLRTCTWTAVVALLLSINIIRPASAADVTFRVTNDGVDSGSCGTVAKPCRSISQAIENATAGDTIEVGAGRYGDISGDGTFTHPGDEHPQLLPGFISGQVACMICITKPLRIRSLHGASVTVIEGR